LGQQCAPYLIKQVFSARLSPTRQVAGRICDPYDLGPIAGIAV
jgi:hypothetical protein